MDEHSLLEDEKDMEEAMRDEDWADEEFLDEIERDIEDNLGSGDAGVLIGQEMAYKDY